MLKMPRLAAFALGPAWRSLIQCIGLAEQYLPLQYQVEDVARIVVAKPGKEFLIEACVATTATYGDRMRSVVRSKCV